MNLFPHKFHLLNTVFPVLLCLLLALSAISCAASLEGETPEEESARQLQLRHRKTIEQYRQGFRLEKARGELEKYRSIYPEDPWILFEESEIAYKVQRWEKAAEKASEAQRAGYDLVESHLLLGKIFFQMNDSERARASFRKAVAAATEEARVFYESGRFHLSLQEYNEAVQSFFRAVELEPDSPNFLLGLATAVEGDQGLEAALPFYERHIELSVPAEGREMEKVKLYLWKNRPQQAISRLEQMMSGQDQDAGLWKLLAEARGQAGDFDAARQAYQKALQLTPEDPSLSIGLAKIYRLQGQLDKSLDILEEVLEKHPEHAGALYGRALFYTDTGKPEEALRDLEKIKGETQENLNVLALRTALAYSTGKLEEEDEYFQKLQQYGQEAQSLIHQFMGRIEAARRDQSGTPKVDRGD